MKNFVSLKNSREFKLVYENGRSSANKYLVLYSMENDSIENHLGISVSKKVGNSVVRHRITRLIRESYRLNKDKFHNGLDLVVVARVNAKGRNYNEIESALLHLAKIQSILKE